MTPTRRLVAVKAVFSGDYSGSRGAFLLVLDPVLMKLDRVHAIVANDKTEDRFRITNDWRTIEDALVSAKLHGQAIVELSRDVQNYIRKAVQDEVMEPLAEAVVNNQNNDVRRILGDVVSKAIADANVLIQVAMEAVVLEEAPAAAATVAAPEGMEPAQAPSLVGAPTAPTTRIRVDPILSPVSGIAAKNVLPGMTMVVEAKDLGASRTAVAKIMALKMPGATGKTQFEGKVLDVSPGDYDRITITMALSPDVIGFTNISGELRVKVSDASIRLAEAKGGSSPGARGLDGGPLPPVSTNLFLWAAFGILAIMALLAYLVFGGIIG